MKTLPRLILLSSFLFGACGGNAVSHLKRTETVTEEDQIALLRGWKRLENSPTPESCLQQNPAFIPAPTEANFGQTVSYSITQVENREKLEQELGLKAKVSYGSATVNASSKVDFSKHLSIDEWSTTIVVSVKISNPPRLIQQPEFKPQFKPYLVSGQESTFQQVCGDEYIAGFVQGGEYYAVINQHSINREEKQSLEAKIAASGGFFSAEAAVTDRLTQIFGSKSINIKVWSTGGNSQEISVAADKIMENVKKFAAEVKVQPKVYEVILKPYATVPIVTNYLDTTTRKNTMENLSDLFRVESEWLDNLTFVLSNLGRFEIDDSKRIEIVAAQAAVIRNINKINAANQACADISSAGSLSQCILPVTEFVFVDLPSLKTLAQQIPAGAKFGRHPVCSIERTLSLTDFDACGSEPSDPVTSGDYCGYTTSYRPDNSCPMVEAERKTYSGYECLSTDAHQDPKFCDAGWTETNYEELPTATKCARGTPRTNLRRTCVRYDHSACFPVTTAKSCTLTRARSCAKPVSAECWHINENGQEKVVAPQPTAPKVQSRLRDFTEDGSSDILWRNADTGDIGAWQLDGIITKAYPTFGTGIKTGSGWEIKGVGDFNYDGHKDIVWYNAALKQVSIWFLKGMSFAGEYRVPQWSVRSETGAPIANQWVPTDGWDIRGVGDLNNDGSTDILWYNPASGEFRFWYMNGSTVVGTGVEPTMKFSESQGWYLKALADMTNDGKLDYVWYNPTAGRLSMWYYNPSLPINGGRVNDYKEIQLTDLYGTSGWDLKGTGDFNNDDQVDLLFVNDSTGQIRSVYFDGGLTLYSPDFAVAIPASSGWKIESR